MYIYIHIHIGLTRPKGLNKPSFFSPGRPVLINRRVNLGLTREKTDGAGANKIGKSASFIFEVYAVNNG